MSSALCAALVDFTDRHARGEDGFYPSAIEGLSVMRASERVGPTHTVYKPSLCVVAQGAKQVMLGDAIFDYGEDQYLAVSVDIPMLGRVTRAAANAPYLALILDIDAALLREVAGQLDAPPQGRGASTLGVFVGDVEPQMADCMLRLVRLADTPQAVPVLYPAITRELYYWLLAGRDGAAILDLVLPASPVRRIAEAIHVIRNEFTRPIRVERLAGIARMSPSSFHQHFKGVTAMTPLQFQKQLRLLEARRLMLTGAVSAAHAAHRVGYESPSQFSREYARLFGAPPRRDAVELRSA
jgi:AraC-like DNA-binding protein